MIILTTELNQSFPIIPIQEVDLDNNDLYFIMTDETTQNSYTRQITFRSSQSDIYYIGITDFDFLKENTFYNIKVMFTNTNQIIYKDRVFCTNQPKETYTINDGVYTLPNIDNNNYITI